MADIHRRRSESSLRPALRPFKKCAAKDQFDEDFLMRAMVHGFGLAGVWPALENLSGRKPRGLGSVYGERALFVGLVTAAVALLVKLKTAVFTFCPHVCLRSQLGRCQCAPFT